MPTNTNGNIACKIAVAFGLSGAVAPTEFVYACAGNVGQVPGRSVDANGNDEQSLWDEIDRIAPSDEMLIAYAQHRRSTPPL